MKTSLLLYLCIGLSAVNALAQQTTAPSSTKAASNECRDPFVGNFMSAVQDGPDYTFVRIRKEGEKYRFTRFDKDNKEMAIFNRLFVREAPDTLRDERGEWGVLQLIQDKSRPAKDLRMGVCYEYCTLIRIP